MNFEETVTEFLLFKEMDQSKKSRGYYKDLMIFYDYLKSKDVTDKNINEFVKGLDTNTVIGSIEYYIQRNKIRKLSTVQRFVSVVKEYLIYIVSNDYVSNDEFLIGLGVPAYQEGSFRNRVNIFLANNKSLDKADSYDPLTDDEVNELIIECDLILNEGFINITRSREMRMLTAALIIKLMLLTGIPYREIIKIQVSSYNSTFGSFKIDELCIRLPKRLIVQFNSYMELREKLAKVNELFIQFEGCELSDKTDYVTYWLKQLSGRQDVTGIIKYAIVQMMTNNINQLAIEKFTKVGDKIIKACKEQHLKDQGISLGVDLDSKIRRSKNI